MMNEEAKCPCHRCDIGYCYKNCDKYNEWQERAEAALEKQIPKKPITQSPKIGNTQFGVCAFACPVCGHKVEPEDSEEVTHCWQCMQAIYWGEDA